MRTHLEQHVKELRDLAETLIPYSFPKVSIQDDQDIIVLRSRQLTIDGYDVSVTFCISDYDKYQLESVQIQGVFMPFLPFALVCKIGRYFLGSENLSYMDIVKDNRKVYCWSLRKKHGRILPPNKTNSGNYEGFTFSVMNTENSN